MFCSLNTRVVCLFAALAALVSGAAAAVTPCDELRWRGPWVQHTSYARCAVVESGGAMYACTRTHRALAPPLSASRGTATYWELAVARGVDGVNGTGFQPRGAWSGLLNYTRGDVVTRLGSSYVALSDDTLGQTPPHAGTWLLLASKGDKGDKGEPGVDGLSFAGRGAWNSTLDYVANDVVSYGNGTFICLADHAANETVPPPTATTLWMVMAAMGVPGTQGPGFVWRGTWASNGSYVQDDVVASGGSTYVALTNSTNRPPPDAAIWALMASRGQDGADGIDGSSIIGHGAWDADTAYTANDLVAYGNASFLCVVPNTNAAPDTHPAYWMTVATVGQPGPPGQGLTWRGGWDNTLDYAAYDLVGWGGSTFLCTLGHPGATPHIPTDPAYWSLLAQRGATGPQGATGQGFVFQGDWDADLMYQPYDVVSYQGGSYVCILEHATQEPPAEPYWAPLSQRGPEGAAGRGFLFRSSWTTLTAYDSHDVVTYQGSLYMALQATMAETPSTSPEAWALWAQQGDAGAPGADGAGFTFRGDYDDATAYAPMDVVADDGSMFVCTHATTGADPPDAGYWTLVAQRGDPGLGYTTRGAWLVGTSYAVRDVVTYSGSSYVAVAASTGTTPGSAPSTWQLWASKGAQGDRGADGTSFIMRGGWDDAIAYVAGDVVVLDGTAYACTAGNTNEEPPNTSYWAVMAAGVAGPAGQGVSWEGGWDDGTLYAAYDLVSYGGNTYICTSAISVAGTSPAADSAHWDVVAERGAPGADGQSITFRDAWDSGASYAAYDLVTRQGSAYLCIVDHTNHVPPDATYWRVLASKGDTGATGSTGATGATGQGFTFKDTWSSGVTYAAYDVATSGGSLYVCLLGHTNHAPASSPTYWTLVASKGDPGLQGTTGATGAAGLTWLGTWASGTSYAVHDAVLAADGSSYICTSAHSNHQPPNPSYWDVLAARGATGATGQGFANKGAWSTLTTYAAYDVVTYGGSSYVCTLGHTSHVPPDPTYWDVFAAKGDQGLQGSTGAAGANGVSVTARGTWSSGTAYVVNDLVTLAGSSYTCVSAHTNHVPPDATYWQVSGQAGSTGAAGTDAPVYGGTSTTSLTIGAGSKAWTLVSNTPGYAYTVGQRVRAAYTTSPAADYMEGVVTDYNSGTRVLTVTVDNTLGSGTFAAWTLGIAGDKGATGATGSTGASGTDGAAGTPAPVYGGTSTTSITIGTGSKAWTLVSNTPGYAYSTGQRVRVVRTSAPSSTYAEGVVASYNSGTRVLTVTVDRTAGSGTYTDWTVGISGDPGADGTNGSNGAAGANGLSLTLRDAWSSATTYAVNDVVTSSGASYACTTAHTNHVPPNAAYWQLMAQAGTASITHSEVQLTDAPTTTSSSYVVLTSTTLSLTSGTYMVYFSGAFNTGTSNTATMSVALYVNAAVRAHTAHDYDSKINLGISLVDVVTIASTQSVDVRWKTSGGTATGGPRTLVATKIG